MNFVAPLRVVDLSSFRELVTFQKAPDVDLNITSRRTLGRRLGAYHDDKMARLRRTLADTRWVATTADVWSSKTRSFLGMTAHWIDVNFERRSAALACRRFAGSHSRDHVGAIHASFDLHVEKLTATTSDNGSNFVKAFKKFGVAADNIDAGGVSEPEETGEDENLGPNEDASDMGRFISIGGGAPKLPNHLRCAAHTLALVATTDFEKLIKQNS